MPYAQPTKIYELTPRERRERLNYLRFKMRVVVNVSLFIIICRKHIDKNFDAKCLKQKRVRYDMVYQDGRKLTDDK